MLAALSLLAAAGVAFATAQAHAATLTKPPIAIVSCRIENFGGYGGSVADVHITYKNTYTAPALKVSFLVRYHGQYALHHRFWFIRTRCDDFASLSFVGQPAIFKQHARLV